MRETIRDYAVVLAIAFGAYCAPAGTPRDIVTRLNAIIVKALVNPDTRERLAGQGAEPIGNTPEEFTAQMQRDLVKWAKVVKNAGIKLVAE